MLGFIWGLPGRAWHSSFLFSESFSGQFHSLGTSLVECAGELWMLGTSPTCSSLQFCPTSLQHQHLSIRVDVTPDGKQGLFTVASVQFLLMVRPTGGFESKLTILRGKESDSHHNNGRYCFMKLSPIFTSTTCMDPILKPWKQGYKLVSGLPWKDEVYLGGKCDQCSFY